MAVKVAGCRGGLHKSCLGVKQGRPLSPTLFGLYIDGLFEHLDSVEGGFGPLLSTGKRVAALMYADDIVLMSTTADDLQRLIDATLQFCNGKGMTISPAKRRLWYSGAPGKRRPGLMLGGAVTRRCSSATPGNPSASLSQ